jgi:hypothetical protein
MCSDPHRDWDHS